MIPRGWDIGLTSPISPSPWTMTPLAARIKVGSESARWVRKYDPAWVMRYRWFRGVGILDPRAWWVPPLGPVGMPNPMRIFTKGDLYTCIHTTRSLLNPIILGRRNPNLDMFQFIAWNAHISGQESLSTCKKDTSLFQPDYRSQATLIPVLYLDGRLIFELTETRWQPEGTYGGHLINPCLAGCRKCQVIVRTGGSSMPLEFWETPKKKKNGIVSFASFRMVQNL